MKIFIPSIFSRNARLITLCTLVGSLICTGQKAYAQYTIYGVTAGTGATIHQINFNANNSVIQNTVTGQNSTQVFSTGLDYVNGLAWDNANSRLFYRGSPAGTGTDDNLASGNGNLYVAVRNSSGNFVQAQVTASASNTLNISTLTFASGAFFNGAYYTIDTGSDDLYRLTFSGSGTSLQYTASLLVSNVDSGQAGSNGINDGDYLTFGDIAITADGTGSTTISNTNGRLFGFASDYTTQTAFTNQFFQGNLPTGTGTSATLTGTPTNVVAPAGSALVQLGFARNSTTGAVGGYLNGHDRTTGQWYSVDTTTGGQTATFTTLARFNDITSGGTFQPVPAPPAAVSVGIGGLVGLIGTGVGKYRTRRRKLVTQ